MAIGAPVNISGCRRFFLEPRQPRQRQYEALRACFVEKQPPSQAAPRFGYSPGTLRVMCSKFRRQPSLSFLVPTAERSTLSQKAQPRKVLLREQMAAIQRQLGEGEEGKAAEMAELDKAIKLLCDLRDGQFVGNLSSVRLSSKTLKDAPDEQQYPQGFGV